MPRSGIGLNELLGGGHAWSCRTLRSRAATCGSDWHFECNCGCHGFEFSIPDGADLPPLANGSGLYCELAFQSNATEEIDILLFTDARGYFSGADVTLGQTNQRPIPDDVVATTLIGIWPSDNSARA